jgi:AraC-like DNA-binding protein
VGAPRTSHNAAAGAIVLLNPRQVHAMEPDQDREWGYAVMFPAATAVRTLAASPGMVGGAIRFRSPVVSDPGLARALTAVHRRLIAAPRDPAPEHDLSDVLRELVRAHAEPVPSDPVESRAVRHILGYLEERHAERVRLSELSALTGLTLFHMVRVFRAATGLPPHAYLAQVRLGRAAALLRQGCPVSAVAFRTGFSDQSHLTRCFKRIVGLTPGQYRRGVLPETLNSRS